MTSIDTTEGIQERHDRATAEHARLVDTRLPDGWLEICMDAGFPGLPAGISLEEAHRRIRAIVNVVLPLHEQALRVQIAKEVLYGGPTWVTPMDQERS